MQTQALCFSPDGRLLAQSGGDGFLRLWRVSDGTLLQTYPASVGPPQQLAFDPAGNLVTMSIEPGLLTVWQVPTE
jgi:WD40 repeat protein